MALLMKSRKGSIVNTSTFVLPQEVARDVESLIERGRYRDLSEAMTEAARLLVKQEQAAQAISQILAIRQRLAGWQANVTEAIVSVHEEET